MTLRRPVVCLIFNELVSNALKHGRTDAEVVFAVKDEHSTLAVYAVYDDGRGFPEGFDPHLSANNGPELVSSLVATDLRRTITYGNQPAGSGQVAITFPL